MKFRSVLLAFGIATVAASSALSADAIKGITKIDSSKGIVLANSEGMTLYTFDKDKPNLSNCYSACAQKWPPLKAKAGEKANGNFSIVTRKDGTKQWAYKSMPLYTWFKDKEPGDITGDGVKGVWHIVKP